MTDIDPQSQGSVDPRGHRSADLAAGTNFEQLPFELSCGRIASVLKKNDSEAGGIRTLLVEPQQRGTFNLFTQEIIAPEQGLVASEAIKVRIETATRSALGCRKHIVFEIIILL